jgi:hypothetical protein
VAASLGGGVEVVVEVEGPIRCRRDQHWLDLGLERRWRDCLTELQSAGRRRGNLRPGLQLANDPQALGRVEGAGGAFERPGPLGLLAGEASREAVCGKGLLKRLLLGALGALNGFNAALPRVLGDLGVDAVLRRRRFGDGALRAEDGLPETEGLKATGGACDFSCGHQPSLS